MNLGAEIQSATGLLLGAIMEDEEPTHGSKDVLSIESDKALASDAGPPSGRSLDLETDLISNQNTTNDDEMENNESVTFTTEIESRPPEMTIKDISEAAEEINDTNESPPETQEKPSENNNGTIDLIESSKSTAEEKKDVNSDQNNEVEVKESSSKSSSSSSSDDEKPPDLEEGLSITDDVAKGSDVPQLIIPTSPPKPQYTHAELDKALDDFIKAQKIPPNDMIKPLIQHIGRRRVDAIANANYDEGERLNSAQTKLKLALEKVNYEYDVNTGVREVESRLDEARRELKETEKEWEENIQAIINEQKNRQKKLMKRQDDELDDFKDYWNDPSSFHEYNKPSITLLNLRQQERQMAILGDFASAKAIKKRADNLEKVETERAQQKAVNGMKAALRGLEARHQRELSGHDRLTQRLLLAAEVKKENALRPLQMAVRKLENMKDSPSKPRRAVTVSRAAIMAPKVKDYDDFDDSPPINTARTMRKLANFRVQPRPNTLGLKGVDVRVRKAKMVTPRRRGEE